MNRTQSVSRLVLALAAGAAVLSVPGPAFAITYYLKATTFNLADPNGGAAIPMWGYVLCQDSAFTNCAASATAPGPALTVPANDTELKISLSNVLPVPTSLVINGLIKPMTPVWDGGETGNRPSPAARVRSFDTEASASGGVADYTWLNVKPGTYLYQSGTQPQVQVQMGLYGAMTKNQADVGSTPALAYPGVAYDNQATLLYSEIDPALHAAVATGSYGTAPGFTSTFNYAPKYFLINGQPYPNANSVVSPVGNTGRTLLRLLNAGLTTHVPMLQGNVWMPVAEDGKPYAYPTSQYTALLPAAKTMDVVLVADAGGAIYPVIDRRLNLSNNGLSNGGMLTQLAYGAAGVPGGGLSNSTPNVPPVATDDVYTSVKGVTLSVGELEGVLSNDSDSDSLPLPIRAVAAAGLTANGGTYTLNANGSFIYVPSATSTATTDSFTYRATDGLALSNAAGTVRINLATPAAPTTLATLDTFNRADANNLGSVSWSQAANTGSGSDLQVVSNSAAAVNSNLGGLAIWNAAGATLGATQGAQFVLGTLHLNSALVLKATGGTANAPANYVRVRYEFNNNVNEVVVSTMVGGNNVSVFVKQAAFPVSLSSGDVLTAVVDAKGLVTVFNTAGFIGGVQLPDVGTWKGTGRIGIQLQTVGATIDSFKGGTL
jgi:hypothetical protein